MQDQSWYYAQGGQQKGPVTFDQLRQSVATGQVQPSDLVWTAGMNQWQPAGTIQNLIAAPPPPPPGYGVTAPAYLQPQYPGAPVLNYGLAGYGQPAVQYAGFWLRFVAYIVDGALLWIIGFGIGMVLGTILGPESPGLTLVGVVLGWLYFALQESSERGATIGKSVLGLRVTDSSGQRISFGRATGRNFAKILSALILMIGFIMAAFTQRKQALHDSMADTLVIRTR